MNAYFKEKMILLGVLLLAFAVAYAVPVMADPAGGSVVGSVTDKGSYPSSSAGSISVVSGRIYEANVTGEQSTYHWAGVYGNATGTLILGDSSNKKMFEWPAKATYVFFDDDGTIDWENLGDATCTDVENSFGFLSGASDDCSNTFSAGTAVPDFKSISTTGFSGTITAKTLDGEATQTAHWVTYAIKDTTNSDVLFAAETEYITSGESSTTHSAYNGVPANYQAILPENGNNGDTSATTYYIWIELY